MNKLIGIVLLWSTLLMTGCSTPEEGAPPVPEEGAPPVRQWTFEEGMIFPADRSLVRPEDGVALADGRLIIADQEHGLRVFEGDGSHRPFGKFAEAGYQHSPPEIVGGPNGVTLVTTSRGLMRSSVS